TRLQSCPEVYRLCLVCRSKHRKRFLGVSRPAASIMAASVRLLPPPRVHFQSPLWPCDYPECEQTEERNRGRTRASVLPPQVPSTSLLLAKLYRWIPRYRRGLHLP